MSNSKRMDTRVTVGSGNVYTDLGFPDAEERLLRSELAIRVATAIEARGLTQTAAATLIGIDQPKVSRLLAGKLTGFSAEQLMRFLATLGHDVEIVVRARRKGAGRVAVVG